jgi:uncharacterized protein YdeI (YjbR/CyaY-like superfamily)
LDVELSKDIESAFRKAGVLGFFRALPGSHQREYAFWIGGAGRAEIRARRIAKTVAKLREKTLLK